MTPRHLLTWVTLAFPLGAMAAPMSLAGQDYFTYGNTNSYSLPFSAIAYDAIYGGGTGPGNPYYVDSQPGQIKDLVVIYTGSDGQGVTTNVAGFDDAFGAPNGTKAYASIDGAVNMTDPGIKAGILNNLANTWDASLSALKAMLAGANPLFLFNNNDTKQDENLAIWAKLWITRSDGQLADGTRYLYLSNDGKAYGQGGTLNGNAALYNPGNVATPQAGFAATDYVLSGGNVLGVDHNLGANQAAYAGDLPLLNDWLRELFKQNDTALGQFTLHLDMRLGCTSVADWGTCDNVQIDNGYEQLFLATSAPNDVPEPGSLALMAAALLGLAGTRRRAAGR